MALEDSPRRLTTIPPWELEGSAPPFVKEKIKAAAHKIFEAVATGKYSFGARLDAERVLADDLGLTRAATRQVIDLLESYEVVVRRPNAGTYVVYKSSEAGELTCDLPVESLDIKSIVESASPFEMSVVCSLLEPEIARLATLYMSVRDLVDLRERLEEIEQITTDAEKFAMLEKLFMMKIAEGTHNRLLITMYRVIFEVRRQPHWLSTRIQTLSPQRIREGQTQLRSLYEALESRDIEVAVEFMKLIVASKQQDLMYSP